MKFAIGCATSISFPVSHGCKDSDSSRLVAPKSTLNLEEGMDNILYEIDSSDIPRKPLQLDKLNFLQIETIMKSFHYTDSSSLLQS
jgi:hypothetical protein